jgi:hypothetical protein
MEISTRTPCDNSSLPDPPPVTMAVFPSTENDGAMSAAIRFSCNVFGLAVVKSGVHKCFPWRGRGYFMLHNIDLMDLQRNTRTMSCGRWKWVFRCRIQDLGVVCRVETRGGPRARLGPALVNEIRVESMSTTITLRSRHMAAT